MMENGKMEMRMRALLDAGDADGACVFARAYLAQSAAERNAEETYALRVLLGETLLALAAESFDESVYIEGATALMQAYNECGDEELYALLYALSCAPNETACRMRYEAGRTALMSGADMPRVQLPDYENLFVRLFPLTDRYSVLFDRDGDRRKGALSSPSIRQRDDWGDRSLPQTADTRSLSRRRGVACGASGGRDRGTRLRRGGTGRRGGLPPPASLR